MSAGYSDRRYRFRKVYWRFLAGRRRRGGRQSRADGRPTGQASSGNRADGRPTGQADGGSLWDVYRAPSLAQIDFDRIVHAENLLATFTLLSREGGASPGVDGLRYDDLSTAEAGGIFRAVSRAIREGQYRPHPTRVVRIPKSDGRRYRELALPVIVDRVMGKAVAEALTGAIDGVLGEHVVGFRPGRGVRTMIRGIAQRIRDHGESWIVQSDIRDCFPSTPVDLVMNAFREYVQDEKLLDLIQRVLRADDRHLIGLAQGNPLSPLAMNAFLHHVLDRPETAAEHHPLPFRYGDNFAAVAGSASNGSDAMHAIQQRLQSVGMELAIDGPPINLQRNGARTEILGVTVSWEAGRLRTRPGHNAWRNLARRLEEAHRARNPTQKANEVAQGWLAAQAQAIESEEREETLNRVRREAARAGFRELSLPRSASNRERQSHGPATGEQRLRTPASGSLLSLSRIG